MNRLKICNGKVYDPLSKSFSVRDIAVDGNKIAEDASADAEYSVDAAGCIVTPGLIDHHIHVFSGIETGCIDPDLSCIPNGVTTAIEGGTSGVSTYPLFHDHNAARSRVRLRSNLNIGSQGLISTACSENVRPECIERDKIKEMFRRYPDELVSLKLRNSLGIVPAGDTGPLNAMLELAEEIGCNVVVHMTNPSVSPEETACLLRRGDVFCHMYQGIGNTLLDEKGKVKKEILKARERGVVFDACNGNANFAFKIAIPAIEQGFLPDIISTDLTPMSFFKPFVYSLPRLMSKYLSLGMSLEQIFACTILKPASMLKAERDLASLAPGTAADIAVFKLADSPVSFSDNAGDVILGQQVLIPQMTVKDGTILFAQSDFN